MAIEKVVVVDDDPTIRRSLELQLRSKRLGVSLCASISEAERAVAREPFDLMFVDVRLPDGNGTDLLARLNRQPRKTVIVMMTGHGSVESAVTCIRAGAFDYIIKPFSSGQIDVVINKAASFIQALKVNQVLSFQASDQTPLIGESPRILQLRQLIQKVAPTEATVLIGGENGTGKELVATEIFPASARSPKPFLQVNCAAVSEQPIQNQFLRHAQRTFTRPNENP